MKAVRTGRRWAHFDDGTNWPLPDYGDDENEALNHTLRYGTPTRSEILSAASVLSAYEALIMLPQRRRNEVVSAIRRALNPEGQ